MKARQWEQVHKGSYTRPRSFSFGWLVFFMLIYTGYLILQIVHFHRVDGWILEFILMGMMSISISIAFSRFGWFFRFMMFEIYSFFVVFFIMNLYFEPSKYVPLVIITAGNYLIRLIILFVPKPFGCRFVTILCYQYIICHLLVTRNIIHTIPIISNTDIIVTFL